MGDFYNIISMMTEDTQTLQKARIMDEKFLKIQHDIDIAGMKNIYDPLPTSDITRVEYIKRTDAIDKNTQQLAHLANNILGIEGVLKRSKVLS